MFVHGGRFPCCVTVWRFGFRNRLKPQEGTT
jgi:hypothetical protein